MNRGAAAACYLPIPGLAWLVARAAPGDRLVRHHSRQGGLLAVLAWVVLMALGFLIAAPGMKEVGTALAGTVLGLTLVGILVGVVSAASGRFVRLRPLWDAWSAREP